ncbi:beta strand repeat-containing protein [Anatilimnocola floriformis]|uniref:beta strand repeat-containing protein n=1 Tax=Anatilimnocola floriformis TaxID=2948575 RepID=UPI0020C4EB86|nr:GEVED domain-containing protein [Anatilimnocola floriformis]
MFNFLSSWLQSATTNLQGPSRKQKKERRQLLAKPTRHSLRTQLRLESLEERSMMAITAADTGTELLITTDLSGSELTVSASSGTLTLTSTTHQINGNPFSSGISTATFNLADFDRVTVLPGAVDANIFNSVTIVGSAAFANEDIYAGGANVDVTGGPLSVNGLRLSSQQLGAPIDIDQPITSTGPVYLHPYSGDVVLRAPINAPGQTVSLMAGYLQTNLFTVSQTSTAVITADSVYAEAGAGVSLNADNQVSEIAGKVNAYGFLVSSPTDVVGDFSFKSVNDLTVSTLATGRPAAANVAGVTTTNGNVTLSSAAGGTITVNEAVTAGGTEKLLSLYADVFDLDASKALTGESVLLQTLGAGVNLTLGAPGLTNTELNAIAATNLTVAASGTITVSGATTLGDDASQLIALRAAAVNVANTISGNSTTGTLRFETNSLALNGALTQSVSAPAVEIAATSNIAFDNTFNFGGLDFTSNELAAIDETTVNTLRFITTGDISFTGATTNFENGFIKLAGGSVALQAGGTISTSSGGAVRAANLSAAGGSVALNSTSNVIGTLAGRTSTGDFEVVSSTALTIGTVDVGTRGIGAAGITASGLTAAVELTANGTVTQTATGGITAPGLAVDAAGSINLTTGVNSVGTVAMTSGGASISFLNDSTNSLKVGTVGGIIGITATAGTANLTLETGGALSIEQAIQTTAGGRLNTVLLTTPNDLTQTASGTIAAAALGVSATGRIELDSATNNVSTFAATTQTNFGVYLKNDSGGTLTIGTVNGISGITSTSTTTLVGINTADDLVVNQSIASTNGSLFHVGLASTDGSVSQAATGTIQATALTVIAESDIQLDQANSVSLFQAHTDAEGAIEFNNSSSSLQVSSASLRNVGSVSGITSDSADTTVELTNTGNLVVSYFIQQTGGGRLDSVALTSANGDVSQLYFSPTIPGKIEADALSVQAQANITLDTSSNNVLTVAMDNDAAGDIKFKNDSGATLVIGEVGTLSGITSDVAATTVSVTTAGYLTVSKSIQTASGGALASVSLTATTGDVGQDSGTLISGTTVALTAGVNIGLDGKLSVGVGDATLTADGAVILRGELELTLTAANDYSAVDVIANSVDLTESDLTITGAYVPTVGDTFTIVTSTSRNGTFVDLDNNDELTLNAEKLRINYSTTDVTLSAIGEPPVVDPAGPFTIPEYTAVATLIGTVTATDPDANTTFTWSITAGNTGGAFAINNAGQITVADASGLVFTTNPTFTLTVQVSDGFNTDTGSVTINLTNVADYDFGDAPATYGVAQHYEGDNGSGPLLGTRDFETASQPNATATGDDANGTDDEDGVTFSSTTLQPRVKTNITLNATAAGIVDAWIDFNRNGVFDVAEKIANGLMVTPGLNTLTVAIPDDAVTGTTYARFRISTTGSTLPTGLADDGEVEDYQLTIQNFAQGTAVLIDDADNPGPTNPDVLVITGRDNVNDAIVVRVTSPGMITVYMNPGIGAIGTFSLASISRMVIAGRSGNDSIVVESTTAKPINTPTTIYGDAGNDTISGGSGPDTIIGGDGTDVMAGNAGDDIFIGGAGNDTISGGAGFDRIVEQPGGANISSTTVRVGTSADAYTQIERIELTGTSGFDYFVFNNLAVNVLIDGAGGSDAVAYTGDGNFVLTDSLLTRTSGSVTSTVTMTGIASATLTGGAANNKFTVSGWTRALAVNGGAGTDTIEDVGSDNYTLTPTQLQRPAKPTVQLNAIENAILTSVAGAVDSKFTIDNWAGTATLTAGAGTDTLAVTDNATTMTLNNTTLTRAGRGAISFNGFEAADLTGGAGANVINASAYAGKLQIDGKGGNDTLTSGSGTAILFGGEGNDTLIAGSGPAVLVGGNGNDTLKVGGTPPGGANAGHAILIGGAGVDNLTGGAGQDLLIDSSTDFDSIAADLANLLAHWTGAGTYAARTSQLAMDLDGALNPDGVSDTLNGGAGALDFFFASLSGAATVKDKLPDINKPGAEIAITNV